MRKTLLAICAVAVLLSGCSEDEIPPTPAPPAPAEGEGNGDETVVTFNFSIIPQKSLSTRATDESAISKIQLLLIGENGLRYYFVLGNEKFVLASIARGRYDVWAIANYADIIKDYQPATLGHLAAAYCEYDENIVMSFNDAVNFTAGSPSLYHVKFIRTVAKLRFNVQTAPNVTVTGLSLCNVPERVGLFSPINQGNGFSNREIYVPSDGAFTAYMPENLAGTVSSIIGRTADRAPAGAMYLLIEGKMEYDHDKGRSVVGEKNFECRIYLGGNTTGDFNIRRNTDYRIDVNIRGDLTSDYRIESALVGYTTRELRSPDGEFIWCGFGNTPSVTISPYYLGEGTANFKCVIEGFSREIRVSASGYNMVRDTQTITITGTVTAGRERIIYVYNDLWNFTPENHRLYYTMTFTEPDGTETGYKRELRFANRSIVYVEPQYGLRYNEKLADITSPHGYVKTTFDGYSQHTEVYHAERSIELTVHPLPGFTFIGWYRSAPPYKNENLITTEPTVTLAVGRRDGVAIYARVQK